MEAGVVDKLDEAWKRQGLHSRMDLFRKSLHDLPGRCWRERGRRAPDRRRRGEAMTVAAGQGNMVKALAFLASWRHCKACGALALYVDHNARTDTPFICGKCEAHAERCPGGTTKMARAGGIGAHAPN